VAVVVLAAFISMGRKEAAIRVVRTAKGSIASTISTNGKIEPVDDFEAHAAAPTTVKRILVREGDHVKAGQLLLELSDADIRAQAAKAQAQLTSAQVELDAAQRGGSQEERNVAKSQAGKARVAVDTAQRKLDALRHLQTEGAASAGEVEAEENRLKSAQNDLKLAEEKLTSRYSPDEIDRLKAQVHQAAVALAAAQDQLRQATILAPQDGIVYYLPVRPGQFVNTGDLLVQVANLSMVQLRGFVDEPEIGRLRTGEQVQVTWDALPGRIWEGTLTRVPSTVVLVGARNVGEIICRIDNSDLKLLPNTNVSVNIITAHAQDAITVPREAVHQEGNQRFVYQVVDGRLQRRDVQTAIANLTQIEITQGLANDAEVALSAVDGRQLRDGMPVRVVTQ